MRGRIPEGVSIKCFVFRGASDIIIETPSGNISGVLAIKDSCTEDSEDSATEGSDSDSEMSIGSGRIQIGFQMSKMKSYKANSFMPVKGGEVVGAIHMALVARALRNHKARLFILAMDCLSIK